MENVMPIPFSGCWIWMGSLDVKGYSRVSLGCLGWVKAYRVSYELFKGPIPPDRLVCHKCSIPSCVNPDHLFAGTHQQNMQQAAAEGRMSRDQGAPVSHCKWGHPYSGDNLHVTKAGVRVCLECRRKRGQQWYARNREIECERNREQYHAKQAAQAAAE